MALIAALIAYLGRQLSTLVQAILGWSVTALFGRLPSMQQTVLAGVLMASVLWPFAVVGVFVPAISAWAFASLPVQKWIGPGAVRWITLGIVVVLPLLVGAATRWVAPSPKGSSFSLRSILAGYSLTMGYAIACIVTAVTVPMVKVSSVLRGWSDEHIYVQPRAGEYEDALRALAHACEVAAIPMRIEPVPSRMRLASTVLKWFARDLVNPIVAQEPKMLRADGLEVYLYPADLLLRGEMAKLSRVRSAMTRTWLERYAYTVADPSAQDLQAQIQRMWQVIQRHKDPRQIGSIATDRLREIGAALDASAVPFEQWVVLDRSLHRLERALGGGKDLLQEDVVVSDIRNGKKRENERKEELMGKDNAVIVGGVDRGKETTGQLLREALAESRQLLQLEVALAWEEAREEMGRLKTGAIALGVAVGVGISAFTLLLVALALKTSPSWIAALILGGVLLVGAGGAAFWAVKALPTRPMGMTRSRLESDYKQFKERIA